MVEEDGGFPDLPGLEAEMVGDVELGEAMCKKARAWILGHPESWGELWRACVQMTAQGDTLQRGTVWSWAIRQGVDVTERPEAWRRDNNLWAGLVRYMRLYLGPLVGARTRRSHIDAAYPDPASMPALPDWCEPDADEASKLARRTLGVAA